MSLLMCPPDYYGIEYEINPWMSRSRQSDRAAASRQWQALYELLRNEAGVEVDLLQPAPGLPDMVFTANGGLAWGKKFIAANFRYDVRRGEVIHFENWFSARGYEIVRLPQGLFFEGEGDLLLCGEVFFAGYHIRSDIRAHQRIAEITGREVLSLELTNEWFYHLDTCFCPLGDGRALFYPPAFDAYARKVLESYVQQLIAVSERDARAFACNAVAIGNSVVMNEGSRETRAALESLGYAVKALDLSEFIKAGGSAKCLVLKVPHGEAETGAAGA
ncbi:MAG TPA: arginine deiminase-related protein [Candidatus Acidoferrales bacterium]|nr:arginine deiminase-related protein [Candidatus Acidoferrales bacterium]